MELKAFKFLLFFANYTQPAPIRNTRNRDGRYNPMESSHSAPHQSHREQLWVVQVPVTRGGRRVSGGYVEEENWKAENDSCQTGLFRLFSVHSFRKDRNLKLELLFGMHDDTIPTCSVMTEGFPPHENGAYIFTFAFPLGGPVCSAFVVLDNLQTWHIDCSGSQGKTEVLRCESRHVRAIDRRYYSIVSINDETFSTDAGSRIEQAIKNVPPQSPVKWIGTLIGQVEVEYRALLQDAVSRENSGATQSASTE